MDMGVSNDKAGDSLGKKGFIVLPREFFLSPIALRMRSMPFSELEAVLYIIEQARFAESTFWVDKHPVVLGVGELLGSLRYLAAAWQWDHKKVMRLLNHLETAGVTPKIQRRFIQCGDTRVTVIKIVDYEEKYMGISRKKHEHRQHVNSSLTLQPTEGFATEAVTTSSVLQSVVEVGKQSTEQRTTHRTKQEVEQGKDRLTQDKMVGCEVVDKEKRSAERNIERDSQKTIERDKKETTTKNNDKNNVHKQPKNELYEAFARDFKERFPMVAKIKSQLTVEQYEKLTAVYGSPLLERTLEALENYRGVGKYNSVYLTLKRWCENERSWSSERSTFGEQNGQVDKTTKTASPKSPPKSKEALLNEELNKRWQAAASSAGQNVSPAGQSINEAS